jgi:hypothetical protein
MKSRGPALWVRAVTVWLLIALAESLHGTLRELWLVPVLGTTAARRVGFVVGAGIVLGIAWSMSRWLGAATRSAQLKVGASWLMLLLGFEIVVGRARGLGWPRIAAEFDPLQGGLMCFGLLWIGVAPLLGAMLRDRG